MGPLEFVFVVDLDSYLTWNVGERKQKHQEISPDSTKELKLSRKFLNGFS
jgi:hypothetical protein